MNRVFLLRSHKDSDYSSFLIILNEDEYTLQVSDSGTIYINRIHKPLLNTKLCFCASIREYTLIEIQECYNMDDKFINSFLSTHYPHKIRYYYKNN